MSGGGIALADLRAGAIVTVEGVRCPVREVERASSQEGGIVLLVEHPAQWATVLLGVPATPGEPDGWLELYELADPAAADDAARAAALGRLHDEERFWGGAEEAEVDASRQRLAAAPPRLATLAIDDYLLVEGAAFEGVLYDDERGEHWLVRRTGDLTLASAGLSTPPPPAKRGFVARLFGRG